MNSPYIIYILIDILGSNSETISGEIAADGAAERVLLRSNNHIWCGGGEGNIVVEAGLEC